MSLRCADDARSGWPLNSAECRFPYTQSENASPGTRIAVLRSPPCSRADGAGDPALQPSSSAAAQQDGSNFTLQLQGMRWGLVPSFTKKDSKPDFWRMFNARSEGVASRSIFSRLLKHPEQRCIVCVEGFYEWKTEHKRKQPYYVHREDKPLLFAGLHDNWKDGEEAGVDMPTVTILTTDSSERLAWLHNRMPVVLRDAEACRRWLSAPMEELESLYVPYNATDLIWHPVTPAMGKASYKSADCAVPLKVATVASFFSASPGKRSADSRPRASTEAGSADVPGQGENGDTEVKDEKSAEPLNPDQQPGPTLEAELKAATDDADVSGKSEGEKAPGAANTCAVSSSGKHAPNAEHEAAHRSPANKRSRGSDADAGGSAKKRGKGSPAAGSKSLLAFFNKA